jgi:hypothetical protein
VDPAGRMLLFIAFHIDRSEMILPVGIIQPNGRYWWKDLKTFQVSLKERQSVPK